jgi:hypothetical protein
MAELYTISELAFDIWSSISDHKDCDCRLCIALAVIEEYLE